MRMVKDRIKSFIIFSKVIYNKILCICKISEDHKNNILIIKVDAIGDYILFRNSLTIFKNSTPYKNCKITVLGNSLWKDIALLLDSDTVDNFMWVNYPSYKTFSYKKTFLSNLSKRKYSEVIVFHYTRDVLTEVLAFVANAPVKIAMNGNFSSQSKTLARYSNNIYTRLISVGPEKSHEFEKNMRFAAMLCKGSADLHLSKKLPEINLTLFPQLNGGNSLDKKYILISSGAGDLKRTYPYSKLLVLVGQLLYEGYNLCFTGTSKDTDFINLIKKHHPTFAEKITDYTGKTTLVQLLQIIKNAELVICNETSVYHISIALQKPVICIAGGGHFSRFANYGSLNKVKLIYHQMPCFNCNWNCIYTIEPGESFPCIQFISIVDVREMLREMI